MGTLSFWKRFCVSLSLSRLLLLLSPLHETTRGEDFEKVGWKREQGTFSVFKRLRGVFVFVQTKSALRIHRHTDNNLLSDWKASRIEVITSRRFALEQRDTTTTKEKRRPRSSRTRDRLSSSRCP